MATCCPLGDGSMARITEPRGAAKRRVALPRLEIDQTSLPEAMETADAAPRAARRSVSDVGVANDSAVGRSDGDGDAAASVGARVGLGSVANCGPVSSSAHATSKRLATSAATYAGQLVPERRISTSREVEQVHPIEVPVTVKLPNDGANLRQRRRKAGCGSVRRARDAASLQQTFRRLVQPPFEI